MGSAITPRIGTLYGTGSKKRPQNKIVANLMVLDNFFRILFLSTEVERSVGYIEANDNSSSFSSFLIHRTIRCYLEGSSFPATK